MSTSSSTASSSSSESTSSSSSSSSTSSSSSSSPSHGNLVMILIVVLGIAGTCLVAIIIYITLRLKHRRSLEVYEPYQGTLVDREHPAAQITPFGGGGPHSGRTVPQFRHNPGEDMRIAFRRPDGAWHFADSRTPFTPAGVSEIDVLPSNTTSSTSLSSSFHLKIPSNKERESKAARDLYKGCDPEFGFLHEPTPPTYGEWCDERSDGP